MTELISRHNKLVKLAAALKQKKYRDELGLFVTEGIRLAEDAVNSGWEIHACIYTDQAIKSLRGEKIIKELFSRDCKVIKASEEVYGKITDTEKPQGILLIIKNKRSSLKDIIYNKSLIIVLDAIQDPGNIGSIVRTGDAAGCSAIILLKGCADIYSPKTVRATMGSLFHIPIITDVEIEEMAAVFKQQNIKLMATALTEAKIYFTADLMQSVAVVFGNEGNGVNPALLSKSDMRITIPIIGGAESLNVAATAAIILYEAVRQRSICSS